MTTAQPRIAGCPSISPSRCSESEAKEDWLLVLPLLYQPIFIFYALDVMNATMNRLLPSSD